MSSNAVSSEAASSVEMCTVQQPDRHARRREQTRRRLLDAARALFARQGVEDTRINEITEEADVGFGSFYNHFDSKEAIVEAVVAETVAAQGGAVASVTADLDDPAEVVAAAHRYFVNLARSDPEWGWLLIRLDVSQKIGLRALGPFARRDLERGDQSRSLPRSQQARRAVRCGRRPSRGHGRRSGWTCTEGRRPPPCRGGAAHVRPVGRGRSRGGAAADAAGPGTGLL